MEESELQEGHEMVAIVCWQLWKARNKEVIQKEPYDPRATIKVIQQQWEEQVDTSSEARHRFRHIKIGRAHV